MQPPHRPTCRILARLHIQPGGIADYHALSPFHYRSTPLGPIAGVWAMRDPAIGDQPAGVIVYTYPVPNCAGRKAAGHFFPQTDKRQNLHWLNASVRCIGRVIIEPRYRGIGAAAKLVRQTLPLVGTPLVESMAVMARFNAFFENAGMMRFDVPTSDRAKRLTDTLGQAGIPDLTLSPHTIWLQIQNLPAQTQDKIQKQTRRLLSAYPKWRAIPFSPDLLDFALKKLACQWHYYLWLKTDPSAAILGPCRNLQKVI